MSLTREEYHVQRVNYQLLELLEKPLEDFLHDEFSGYLWYFPELTMSNGLCFRTDNEQIDLDAMIDCGVISIFISGTYHEEEFDIGIDKDLEVTLDRIKTVIRQGLCTE